MKNLEFAFEIIWPWNSTANSAYSPRKWAKWAELAVLFSWQLITAPTILIFSIAMGADYSFEPFSIVHWVPQFFMHNKLILGRVGRTRKNVFLACFRAYVEHPDDHIVWATSMPFASLSILLTQGQIPENTYGLLLCWSYWSGQSQCVLLVFSISKK